jgi:hypothetical protein
LGTQLPKPERMKLILTLILPCLFLSGLVINPAAYEEDDVVLLQALRLDDNLAKVFRQMEDVQIFELNRDNVLRPERTHQLAFSRRYKKFLLVSKAVKDVTSVVSGNYEKVELDGGVTIHCYCMIGNDDCAFNPVGTSQFKCSGSCACGVSILIQPGKDILEYQSPEGNWFSPNNL